MVFALLGMIVGRSASAADEASGSTPGGFAWKDDPAAKIADLTYAGKPVVRYMYAYDAAPEARRAETFKPYHHVFGPESGKRITKGPGGLFTHHRGIFVGWNKTGYEKTSSDFWHGTNGNHQKHVRFLEKRGERDFGMMAAEIHWSDKADKPVIVETRTLTARAEPASKPSVWVLDVSSRLESRRGTITLDGDRQHAGLQFRADQPVADAKGTRYIRPAAFPQKPEAIEVGEKEPLQHVNLGWFAGTFELEGRRYTVAYFEDPSLPKPSRYSERPYGRFGAFFKTTLEPERPLTLRYRLEIHEGVSPSRDALQERYDGWVRTLTPAG
jgi:hypothetical protein